MCEAQALTELVEHFTWPTQREVHFPQLSGMTSADGVSATSEGTGE